MFLKFKKVADTIFLDKDSPEFSVDGSVNVILSPTLYWVKKVSLPVTYLREVKPLLPSLFEDNLPEGNYSYHTYKKDDFFYIFAYEDKVILDLLKVKGINLAQLNRVHFAQSELDEIDTPLKIGGEKSIYLKDGLVLVLPDMGFDTQENLNLENIQPSKHYIVLEQFAHIVNNKTLYTFMGVLAVFITLVFMEYFLVHQKTQKALEAKEELFAKNGLKSTMMQNRSLLKEYKMTHERQMKFRNVMSHVLQLRLSKDQKISLMRFKQNSLHLDFIGVSKGSEKRIIEDLRGKGLKLTSSFKSDILKMEIAL